MLSKRQIFPINLMYARLLYRCYLYRLNGSHKLNFGAKKQKNKNLKHKAQFAFLTYLGDNKKKITVLHSEPDAAFLTDDQFKLISGILTACKLSMADIALVNLAHQKMHFQEIKQQLHPQFLILFDISPASIELPFTIPPYQIQDYNNCKMLVAGSLQYMTIENEEVKKEKILLWNALRKMFSI